MTPAGQVKQSRQKKFRQINRYLEMVDDMYPSLPEAGPLHVVDFGCGLSYLTFAVHHLLTALHGRQVQLLGIDQNEQIIRRCRQIAADLQLPGLEFRTARIDDLTLAKPTDLAISLHACDTATDQALAMAVSAEARVILAAPCCQHELASSIQSPPLDVLLRQGILKERLAALATDALRAIALEAAGYRTQILEFIDLEHTPKNLLLRAVRRTGNEPLAEAARREYLAAKEFLGAAALATDAILEARGPGILMAP
jgi:SAM-dependent methyltransferase